MKQHKPWSWYCYNLYSKWLFLDDRITLWNKQSFRFHIVVVIQISISNLLVLLYISFSIESGFKMNLKVIFNSDTLVVLKQHNQLSKQQNMYCFAKSIACKFNIKVYCLRLIFETEVI